MELFIITYQGGDSVGKRGAPRIATVGKEQNKSIQVAFDPGGREIVSSCAQIKFFTRT